MHRKSKLIVKRESIRVLSSLELGRVDGGMPQASMVTDEMGKCCGTIWCNTREDRDCWTTYTGCN